MTSRTLDLEGLDLEALIGARVRGLSEYAPEPLEVVARRLNRPVEALIKLDANENPYGPPPAVREVLGQYTEYHRYPDAVSRDLRAALGARLGVDPYQIVVGNGSDELIDLLLRLFRPDARFGRSGGPRTSAVRPAHSKRVAGRPLWSAATRRRFAFGPGREEAQQGQRGSPRGPEP